MDPNDGLSTSIARAPDRVVVTLGGDIDLAHASAVRRLLEAELADGAPHLVLHLAGVGFIDSLGIGALVGALRLARSLGAGLSIAEPSARVVAALRLAGLTELFPVLDVEPERHDIA